MTLPPAGSVEPSTGTTAKPAGGYPYTLTMLPVFGRFIVTPRIENPAGSTSSADLKTISEAVRLGGTSTPHDAV
jgi:hypothetical protein